MSDRADRIAARLSEALEAVHVTVEDESHLHAGHAGAKERGGGHFRALIVSARFDGLSRVKAQQLVYAALGDMMTAEIHALAMRTLTPAAWKAEQAAG
jgi:BolA protein